MNKKVSILVVDDDAEIGFMIKMLLEFNGFAVIVSERSEQTEELIRDNNIDLILLDMLISGVKGADVCARLKKNIAFAHIPVMMISALPDVESICLQAGADDFVYKPFEMQGLISKINKLVGLPI